MHRLWAIVLVVAFAAFTASGASAGSPPANPNYTPVPPKKGFSYPDCYCTDSGGKRVEMGEIACLKIGTREILARCDMSVNNPTWRKEADGCPGV
jgi:hypothetical protein